jgi:hypothetical protein
MQSSLYLFFFSSPDAAEEHWKRVEESGSSPDMFRPEKLLEFRDVIPISAASDPASVERLKWRVREVMDEPGDDELSEKSDELIVSTDERMREYQPSIV